MIAQYPSHCRECESDIEIGDEIQAMHDGAWVHVLCPDSERLVEALRGVGDGSVCGECYQVRSVSGACGCE